MLGRIGAGRIVSGPGPGRGIGVLGVQRTDSRLLTTLGSVGEDAGRQQSGTEADHVRRLGDRGPQRRTGEGVGDQGEDEHADPATQLAHRLADPEHREVVVAAKVPEARHTRNIYCAMRVAQ